jgi:outer membrane receptor protein involved in Fe transport
VRISQPPPRDFLYDDRTGRMDPRRPQGNPTLSPSTSISYEVAYKHRVGELWSGRVGLFYRDLFRQVSARTVPGPGPGGLVFRYEDDDAGHAQGFELTTAREDPGRSRVELGYTWMIAEGSESFEDGLPFYPLTLAQPPPIGEHPLAWDQRQRFTLVAAWTGRLVTASWSTAVGSGLPWTPASVTEVPTDLSLVHTKRLDWSTVSDLSLRSRLAWVLRPVTLGLEVRNVFDFRGQSRVSIDGYPNHTINTAYDDYAAYRTETGLGGAAYWDNADGAGHPGWVRVYDPRLDVPPRTVRLKIETEW